MQIALTVGNVDLKTAAATYQQRPSTVVIKNEALEQLALASKATAAAVKSIEAWQGGPRGFGIFCQTIFHISVVFE